MTAALPLARLATTEGYRRHFMDTGLWKPFVRAVCQEHGWTCEQVRPGRAGTFPTFLVDEQRVVKFFGPPFDGGTCLQVEREMAGTMEGVPEIPIAGLLAAGTLDEDPRWGYLVYEFIPGVSLGEMYEQLLFDDKLCLARQLGTWVKRLHQVRLPASSCLPHLNQTTMQRWFTSRQPLEQVEWPPHLATGLPAYLERNAQRIQSGARHIIHADLTQDHLLGQVVDGHWQTRAVIDFGDAMVGNLYYELAALHLDLFNCDKQLLMAFLESYGLESDPDFPFKAMTTTLLHQFDVYGHLFTWKPELKEAASLDVLAGILWQLDL